MEQKTLFPCKSCTKDKPRELSHVSKNGTKVYIDPETKNQWMSKALCADCSLDYRKNHYKEKVRPKLIETNVLKNVNKSKYNKS